MRTKLIKIGNSEGVRIPKPFLKEIGWENEANMKIKDGGIFIKPDRKKTKKTANITPEEVMRMYGPSYSALAKEWDTPEEDEAWADL